MLSLTLAQWIVRILAGYIGLGFLFAIPFAARWAGRLDPVAAHGTWGFRLLILPGGALLWPLLAWRLLGGGESPPRSKNPYIGRPR